MICLIILLSDDENQMDDMIAGIGMEYDLGSGDQHPLPEW
jgi:hypothetical protein